MAMGYIWTCTVLISIVCGIVCGTEKEVAAAAMSGAQAGVSLTLSLAGAICLWSAFAKVMERSGLSEKLSRFLRPLFARLFPQASEDSLTLQYLCGNFTANLLGLGNAATPLGIACIKRMKHLSNTDCATDEMCRLIVLNTASVQLIPATVGALRASNGASHPFDILPAVWVSSILSVVCGLFAAKLLERRWRN
ncbi:MAG: spore maturation protein A [Oscillospiraceae bacterium]|nr:spore maturation protein A [Oscillospiraceae bacterium]